MPTKPSWFQQLPVILETLDATAAPVVDRAAFEKLFGVKRRRAQQLMTAFGGFEAGGTCLLERTQLLGAMRALQGGEEYGRERRRKARVVDQLDEARRVLAARRIPITPPPLGSKALPEGVELGPGELRVSFSSAEELLTRLFALSQTIAEDFVGFEERVNPPLRGTG